MCGVQFRVFGEGNDTFTKLFVQCDLPGDLDAPSKSAWLCANGSYTVNIGRTDIDRAAEDRQTALTYLMARRVTDALGCENKPLEKPPVVKPLPAPDRNPAGAAVIAGAEGGRTVGPQSPSAASSS
ncbi:hypothetical protein [Streptomyces sp. NPDC090036]|uniref:hypothetical protein n=1 Tax=Streptomyces sp. NPDC090036 TaxID=3365926 RepID=UPI003829CE7B